MSEKVLLRCVNMADLFRISGVASQFAELLEAAGVDTVKELRNRNVDNLAAKMAEVNAAKKLVRVAPSAKVVASGSHRPRRCRQRFHTKTRITGEKT